MRVKILHPVIYNEVKTFLCKMPLVQNANQILMLMYKGLLLRRQQYIVTILEIVIPLLVASIPLAVIGQGNGPAYSTQQTLFEKDVGTNSTSFPPLNPYIRKYSSISSIWFLYAPNETAPLFDEALRVWKARAYPKVPEIYSKGYNTEEELEDAALTLMSDNTVFGTVFLNFPRDGKLPDEMSYKIRYGDFLAETFHTESKLLFLDSPQPGSAYESTAFLSWQAAVEQAFISIKSGKSIESFEVMMQRFPYPPYQKGSPAQKTVILVCMCFLYSLVGFYCIMVKRVVQEKANRTKELLKMMGMSDFNYWISTFLNFFLIGLIIMLIVTIMYTAPLPNKAQVLEKTNFVVLFMIFMLYLASSILYCLAITTVFNRPNVAVTVALILNIVPQVILFIFYFITDFKTKFFELSLGNKLGICLLPYGGLQIIFMMFSVMMPLGEHIGWSTLGSFTALPDLNIAMVMSMMFLSCVIFTIIIWYVDAVWPWQYGVPKPFYFMFTKSYWCGPSKKYIEVENQFCQNTEYFEDDPAGITPGIIIKNLRKVFKSGVHSKAAVDGISLNVYSGQITALLGRNGAGKTTTISILTGLFAPTSGSAAISGWDIRTNMKKARESLGVCPQDNILFPELTVEQHMKLIAGMKGVKWNEITSEVEKVMKLVNLTDKRKVAAQNLSGGMKRKLCLGLAVIGNSKVLFLDEPTSGMDPETRRVLWDILLAIRRNRTIVLTTHYMEEADILGDRIAIMVDGKMRCCGSPMFLKRKFGTGYHLNVVRSKKCDTVKLTSLLNEYVPEVALEDSSETDLKYSFSGSVTGKMFASMFKMLESKKSELGISSFGMTVTTLDDVFLKVNTEDEVELSTSSLFPDKGDESALQSADEESFLIQTNDLECGFKLWISCIFSMFLKRFAYFKSHWSALLYQIVFPFFLICFFLITIQNLRAANNAPPVLLNLKSVYGPSEGIYKPDASTKTFANEFYLPLLKEKSVQVTQTNNPEKYILDYGKKDLAKYLKHLLVGGNSSSSSSSLSFTAWYNGEPYHVLPMSLNIMHVAILRYLTTNKRASISLTNAPLPFIRDSQSIFDKPMFLRIITCCFISLALGYMSASYVSVAIQECASKAKLLQLMTGMSAFTYWFGMFLWDIFSHSVASILLLIPFAMFTASLFFGHFEAIGTVLLLLLLFGWSSIPLCYIFSLWIKKPATGYLVILCLNIILGLIASQVMSALSESGFEENIKFKVALFFLRLLPIFSISYGFSQLMVVAFQNARCESIPPKILNYYYCSLKAPPKHVFTCCGKDVCGDECYTPTLPIAWDTGCGKELMYLAVCGFLYFSILLFLESEIPEKFLQFVIVQLLKKNLHMNSSFLSAPASDIDSDVLEESQRIENSDPRTATQEALITVGLTKYYGNFRAVDHLTFAVYKQECFGFLGINGAGKTSTFKMLTGDIRPTEGNAFIDGYSVQTECKKFQSFIGYCPQYDALIDRLTGREMLNLFATIRGIPNKSRDNYVNKLIIGTDLQEHADKQTRFYSGGNKRKLSLALALTGSPPLILLDEPTCGVDPLSRRKIWCILAQAREATQAAVVLCTHSMEECEALCSRLSIMVKGQFRCLGSIQHLKSKFGKGFTVVIKFQNKEIIDSSTVDVVKKEFIKAFPSATLKDFHQGVLTFHITDPSVLWSYLFNTMEHMKHQFQLEDYFVSGTTLEQIFLAFAQDQ